MGDELIYGNLIYGMRTNLCSTQLAAVRRASSSITNSFHKRVLPSTLVSLSSSQGKVLFREALLEGGMESFFALSEQFVTQSEPSFCAISSLAMVLNALNYDPKKVWKGSWRWVTEETLQCESHKVCGHSLDKMKVSGLDFGEFEALGKCHGVTISSHRARASNREDDWNVAGMLRFREAVDELSSSGEAKSFIISNFSRKHLGQTGDGHFSPIGGYHKSKDLVLVMDVARFKYPPFWVPLEKLWESMVLNDKTSGSSRGYFVVSVMSEAEADSNESVKKNFELSEACPFHPNPTAVAATAAVSKPHHYCNTNHHHHHH